MPDPAVRLTLHPTEEDFLRGADAFWAMRGIGHAGNFGFGGAAIAGFGVAVWAGVAWAWVGMVAGSILCAMTALRRPIWRRHLRRSGRLSAPTTSVFGPDGIDVTGPLGQRHVPWIEMRSWSEDERYLFLDFGRNLFSALPKTAFAVGDAEALTALLDAHVRKRRRRWL